MSWLERVLSSLADFVGGVAERVKRRFCDDHDRMIDDYSFNPYPGHVLSSWIRRFTMIISARWLRTSSKFTWEEVKNVKWKAWEMINS